MARKYYAAFRLDEPAESLNTGRNASTEQECIEAVFDLMTEGMDDEDEEEEFDQFSDEKKERYVKSVYSIEEQDTRFN